MPRKKTDPHWHGWINGNANLSVGPLPNRRQVAVYFTERHPWTDDLGEKHTGASIRVLARCNTSEDAVALMNVIDALMATEEDESDDRG
jgi:hypothetical protein